MKEYLKMRDCDGIKRNVGFVESGCFFSHRDYNNLFRKFGGGFGISKKILGYLNSIDVVDIEIDYMGSQFKTNPLMFCASGLPYNDLGDKQLILNLNLFDGYEHQIEL